MWDGFGTLISWMYVMYRQGLLRFTCSPCNSRVGFFSFDQEQFFGQKKAGKRNDPRKKVCISKKAKEIKLNNCF
jgi:hypothetical protein